MSRSTTGIPEADLVASTLRLLSEAPGGFLTTAQLIEALTELCNPTGKDAEIIPSRTDTYFSQKVRNLISHRDRNFISEGLAEYNESNGGLEITPAGRAHLSRQRPI